MPKAKTKKSIAKRVTITKRLKFLKRAAGQDHFNSREAGRITVRKRRDRSVHATNTGNVRKSLPYYLKRR